METETGITPRSVAALSAIQCCSETSDFRTIVHRICNVNGNALLDHLVCCTFGNLTDYIF
jgi:hypothetical protein